MLLVCIHHYESSEGLTVAFLFLALGWFLGLHRRLQERDKVLVISEAVDVVHPVLLGAILQMLNAAVELAPAPVCAAQRAIEIGAIDRIIAVIDSGYDRRKG